MPCLKCPEIAYFLALTCRKFPVVRTDTVSCGFIENVSGTTVLAIGQLFKMIKLTFLPTDTTFWYFELSIKKKRKIKNKVDEIKT